MKQRNQRKAHTKSRSGCTECKHRHQKCDEVHPQCGNCVRLATNCSLNSPDAALNQSESFEERPLALADLRLLHHWHTASNSDDFLVKFVDQDHVDHDAEYDQMITLAFKHPYLLHIILGISALHMLHSDPSNEHLYKQATVHNLNALRLSRPHIRDLSPQHSSALYCFAGFASLYATAEPPLRTPRIDAEGPTHCLKQLLAAFEMGRGIRPVLTPHRQQIEDAGFLDAERWKDNRDEVTSTLEAEYPQLPVLQTLIDNNCDSAQRGPCSTAARLLFTYIAVLANKPVNHSTISLIQRWPTDIDAVVLKMMSEHHPVALILLAHYTVLMHMRRNYWFFARWPMVLLRNVEQALDARWHPYLEWPLRETG